MQLALPNADQRIADILGRVRVAFAEKGFDGASMQDLARAAGMSVGNFYRYFPSKAAIVEKLIANDLDEMQLEFSSAINSDRPMHTLRGLIRAHIASHNCNDDGQLWAEINAAALRKPEIGVAANHMETVIVDYLTHIFAAETGMPHAQAKLQFCTQAEFIVLLVKSTAMIRPQKGPQFEHLTTLIIRTIDQTLDDVASAGLKG